MFVCLCVLICVRIVCTALMRQQTQNGGDMQLNVQFICYIFTLILKLIDSRRLPSFLSFSEVPSLLFCLFFSRTSCTVCSRSTNLASRPHSSRWTVCRSSCQQRGDSLPRPKRSGRRVTNVSLPRPLLRGLSTVPWCDR